VVPPVAAGCRGWPVSGRLIRESTGCLGSIVAIDWGPGSTRFLPGPAAQIIVGANRLTATVNYAAKLALRLAKVDSHNRPSAVAHGRQLPSELKMIASNPGVLSIEKRFTQLGLQAPAPPSAWARSSTAAKWQ